MFCTACGASSAEGSRFCGQCGAAINGQALQLKYPSEPLPLQLGVNQIRPWVRFWARAFDMYIWSIVAGLFAVAVQFAFTGVFTAPDEIGFGIAALFVWIFVEALFLSSYGWTPGKWLLRTSVRTQTGALLSYDAAMSRSFAVWWRGLAAGFPLVNLGTMAYSKAKLTRDGVATWDRDGGFVVKHEPISGFRVAFALIFFAVVPPSLVVLSLASRNPVELPPIPTETAQGAAMAKTRWEYAVKQLGDQYPQINYGNNLSILNEKVSQVAGTDGSDYANLLGAYAIARTDARWQSTPVDANTATDWVDPQPVVSTPTVPVANAAAESARWATDAAAFTRDHPALNYGHNVQVMQEKLDALANAGMTNLQMMQSAYASAQADRRWSNVP